MRETLDKLLQKLGVNSVLHPYETQPWVHYDEEKGLTCSAEVRMGGSGQDVEAEIQLLKDDADEDDGTDEDGEGEGSSGLDQVLWMHAEPVSNDGKWSPKALRIKGKNFANEIHDWEGKGCQFFRSAVEALLMGEIPDFERLQSEHMKDENMGSGGRGRIGRKAPKANPGALMGMKK